MKVTELNKNWEMRLTDGSALQIPETFMPAKVPGSVFHTLLEAGLIPDPYYRDNELRVLSLAESDYEYRTTVVAEADAMEADALILRFEGVDTIADIRLNGRLIGHTENMHRTYEFDVTDDVKPGENELRVYIYSPVKYIREEQKKVYTGGSNECMEGFPHIRKSHCMFGWDWGPRIPDSGIFRAVKLLQVNHSRFEDIRVIQEHDRDTGTVRLDFEIQEELIAYDAEDCETLITVTGPSQKVYTQEPDGTVLIEDPELWWPNGFGAQPLYQVTAKLVTSAGVVLDVWEKRIGLRTMTVNTGKDEWGERFAHEVNGVCIFAMGADYIPEDNLMPRITKERTEALLKDAVAANHNCIRIWGGGYYPDDWFYDLCDELGLLVWQDFMFACASYELDEAFDDNIRAEVRDNIRRIRHHACLALWCGNNEMETQTLDGCWKPSKKQVADYTKIYEYIIPSIVKEEDPDTFYWPSSPSSGGSFDNPWDENRGDTHYWDVWHGNKPFTEYRKFRFRYLSEFGFQSFPDMKTIESFTLPEDRNVFSRVMEMHQRNVAANGKILNYLSATYLYPKNFEQFVYASQLLQADAIRYGVEHFRRHRGQCMGTVVWQLNDIWPVASWASVDYYGHWKALHYAERKMFAPVMISCEEHGEIDGRPFCISERKEELEMSIRLNVANETRSEVRGTVKWQLHDNSGAPVNGYGASEEITVPALSSVWMDRVRFHGIDELKHYVSYSFCTEGRVVSEGTVLFTAPKHFEFLNPNLKLKVQGNEILIEAERFAKNVAVFSKNKEKLVLSDNFFDMNPGKKVLKVEQGSICAQDLEVKSVYDIA